MSINFIVVLILIVLAGSLITGYLVFARLIYQRGFLEGRALFDTREVAATVKIKRNKNLITITTPFSIELKARRYKVKATHEAQTIEKDVEIRAGEKAVIEFPFVVPRGTLECRAIYDEKEVTSVVEIYDIKTEKLVEEKTTPFTIDLKEGRYRLKAKYPPPSAT